MSIFDKAADALERKLAEEQAALREAERRRDEAFQAFRARFNDLVATVVRPLFQAEAAAAIARGYQAEVIDQSSAPSGEPQIDFRFLPVRGTGLIAALPASQVASFRLKASAGYQSIEYLMMIDVRRHPDVIRKGRLDEIESGGLERLFEEFVEAALNRGP